MSPFARCHPRCNVAYASISASTYSDLYSCCGACIMFYCGQVHLSIQWLLLLTQHYLQGPLLHSRLYPALLLEIYSACPVKELSSAESGNTGSYSSELLEVSRRQGATGTRC